MRVTIELYSEMEEWVARKLAAGQFASPEEFVNARLTQDWLEEKIEESLAEPGSALTEEDWAERSRRLEEVIARKR
jgi:Arc/MetJ-type ribon-helix-helix transcriptional regulator